MPESHILTRMVERLSSCSDLESITRIVSHSARDLIGADGTTFVLRDEELCYYADESAISPLWKGKRFPAESCVSGWSMIHRQVVTIRDIDQDPRIPQDAYRPTFVKSLCMVPIRSEAPIGAIGCYWANEYEPSAEQIKLLQIIANCSATALENLELRTSLARREIERKDMTERQRALELQLYSIAHDLKNPLSTIVGLTDLIQYSGKPLNEKHAQYLEIIARTGQRMNQQIDKMLALYRLSNQSIQKKHIDLSAIAYEVAEDLKSHDASRKVDVEIAPGLSCQGDPVLIRLALENLISNAFKYSRKKPSTWIRFDRTPEPGLENELAFELEDRGAGFDQNKAGLLFQPLVRLHSDSDFSGTGLGLASVARIVELHGGRVWAEGRPSLGATFYFALPGMHSVSESAVP